MNYYKEVLKEGIIPATRQENGNIAYDFYFSTEDQNEVLLVEKWTDNIAATFIHYDTPHYQKLREIKEKYVDETIIERYEAEDTDEKR